MKKEVAESRHAERIAPVDVFAAIQQAMEICQNLKINAHAWEGVPPRRDRLDQARRSVKMLSGFGNGIKELDKARWNTFREEVFSDMERESYRSRTLIRFQKLKDKNEWSNPAQYELSSFFAYIDLHCPIRSTFEEIVSIVTGEYVTQIVKDFLDQYIGHGAHKSSTEISPDGIEVGGFDGANSTCPVSLEPHVAMKYFGYACAEYLLMNAIRNTYLLL